MTPYRISKRMQDAAEFRKSCLINIDMRREAFTAYGRSALILHAIYPQLPFRHVTGEDGMTRPMGRTFRRKSYSRCAAGTGWWNLR